MGRQRTLQLIVAGMVVLAGLAGCGAAVWSPVVPARSAAPALPSSTPVAPATAATPVPPEATPVPPSPTRRPQPQPGSPGVGDSFYPGFGNGGYDVQHYTLELNVHDLGTSALDGVTTIVARATQDLSALNVDFVGFTIESLSANGQPAGFRRNGQELTVDLPAPLWAGETFTLVIAYSGVPQTLASVSIPMSAGWVTFDGGSYVMSEPDGAASYYPVNDHPLDKASYTFRITVPRPFEAVANGVLDQTVDHGDATTFVWEARDPMASYLTTVNIGEFELEAETAPNAVPIRNYYAVGVTEAMRQPFARQGEILALYSDLFGPYPFEVYGAVVVNAGVVSAVECQTLSVFGAGVIDAQDIAGTELTVAHEMAHQWFGDSISVADWSDIWLSEGFATYAEGLWLEHVGGRAALDEWVKQNYRFVVEFDDELIPPGRPHADDLFNLGVYYRGALALHALRLEVGDEAFATTLKTYDDRYKGGNATTADFIAVAEEVSGRDLAAFFERWLYSEEIPPIPALGLAPR